jgi:hypothetical protein
MMPHPLSVGRGRPARIALSVLLLGCLAGCASYTGDVIPAKLGGLPADVPARSATPIAYPAVHDMPAPRPIPMLDEDQQMKLEAELKAARDRQKGRKPAPKRTAPQNAGASGNP